ncbi:hypothetical protein G4V62_13450 [Bacillaceae bacterium SIJ1]|uniref:hypothetical protein n=1 Tax=Litoribacterium kuwaitense TaxID=1398745 RepID=UPI0013EDEF37|nr:hypothetical protein [Litoribacterium kuwaitense]NGP45903.1 hypothetical protein [Litoribacterium kuwaitense]
MIKGIGEALKEYFSRKEGEADVIIIQKAIEVIKEAFSSTRHQKQSRSDGEARV